VIATETVEVTKLTAKFGEAILSAKDNRGDLYVCVNRDKIVEIVQFLKDDEDLAFDYFVECVGADYSRWEHPRDLDGRFEVIYNLMSTTRTTRIFLKVSVNDGQSIPTLKHV